LELFSVPISGGAGTKLNGAIVAGGDLISFDIDQAGSRVAYVADQDIDNVLDLYSVPVNGGAATKLSGAMVPDGDVHIDGYHFTPDGSRIIYVADRQTDDVLELYSVPAAGGASVKLNGNLGTTGSVNPFVVSISADGSRAIYHADQETDETFELYSAPVAGGPFSKLNGALVAGGDVIYALISPDGSLVVYTADQEADDVTEIYGVPITGGAASKLNGPLVSGSDVAAFSIQISPYNNVAIYMADQEVAGIRELFATFDDTILTPTPTATVPVTETPPAGAPVYLPAITG
jgi:hypothetical protein